MPPLAIHTSIAKQMADSLTLATLDDERGNVYLGATAPDIRVITRWERQRTHFFDIHNFDDQHSVDSFFASNPTLSESAGLDARTQAFISGYLSHLVVDEMWIGAIYRPFFGERSPLGGSLRANVMDRALQFSMDADARSDRDLMTHVFEAVTRCDLQIEIDFIDRDTLGEWQNVITDYVRGEPNWERFRTRARQHIQKDAPGSDDEFDELVSSLPDLVDQTLNYLDRERIDDVIRESLDASTLVVKEYLRCG